MLYIAWFAVALIVGILVGRAIKTDAEIDEHEQEATYENRSIHDL